MEVRVTKCQNGHYYDANKHPVCPHCGALSIILETNGEKKQRKVGLNLFKKKQTNIPKEVPEYNKISPEIRDIQEPAKLDIQDMVSTDSSQVMMIEDVVTEGMFSESAEVVIEDEVTEAFFNEIPEMFEEEPEVEEKSTLLGEIKNVTADNDARTIGFFSINTDEKVENEPNYEPVVGWLACIKGKHLGRCFNIVTGRNSVGRNDTNYICLSNEESVSREKHAWIIYEPRKREFFIKPGESSGLTYVNDENVLESQKLKHNDILEFGDTKFIFVPLCGENFTWNDYITKE